MRCRVTRLNYPPHSNNLFPTVLTRNLHWIFTQNKSVTGLVSLLLIQGEYSNAITAVHPCLGVLCVGCRHRHPAPSRPPGPGRRTRACASNAGSDGCSKACRCDTPGAPT